MALTSEIISRQYAEVTTVYEAFLRGMRISGECSAKSDRFMQKGLDYYLVSEALFPGTQLSSYPGEMSGSHRE